MASRTKTTGTPNGVANRPPEGERTRAQMVAGMVGIASVPTTLYLGPMLPGSFETYRAMRTDPTIALARAAAFAPIFTAPWTFKADDDAPDEWVKLVSGVMMRLRDKYLNDAVRALDYGFQAFEKVWEIDDDGAFVIRKLKPLVPDFTEPLLTAETGEFVGLIANGVQLGTEKCAWITYDSEAGDPYGRSRHENIRRWAWKPWMDMCKRINAYSDKGAGIVPIMHYPVGTSQSADGTVTDNSVLAAQAITAIATQHGITIPNQLQAWAEDILRGGGVGGETLKELLAWRLTFLEAAVGHGSEMLEVLKHYDAMKLRGWLVPERSVTEGQFGTKAEAGVHGDMGMAFGYSTAEDIIRQTNEQVVDQLLAVNFGPSAKGKVRIVLGQITDEDRAFFRDLFKTILTNPNNSDLLSAWVDVDSALDVAAIPKAEEVVDAEDAAPAGPESDPAKSAEDAATADAVMGSPQVPTPTTVDAAAAQGVVQDTAFNGAQVTALQGMLQSVANGELPLETARAMIAAAFPALTPEQIDAMVAPLATFKPKEDPKPDPPKAPGAPPPPPPTNDKAAPAAGS